VRDRVRLYAVKERQSKQGNEVKMSLKECAETNNTRK